MSDRPMREFAVPLPAHMKGLAVDHRGFPVPWFVTWFKDGQPTVYGVGEPDFRVVDPAQIVRAVRQSLCWVCGGVMGAHKAFVIGPMCAVNRTISEPPSHMECARVEWWAEGREATQAEVVASITSGLPSLVELAEEEGLPALRELGAYMQRALPLLPAAT